MIVSYGDGNPICESSFIPFRSFGGGGIGGGMLWLLVPSWLIGIVVAAHHFCCHEGDEPTCMCKCWWPLCAVRVLVPCAPLLLGWTRLDLDIDNLTTSGLDPIGLFSRRLHFQLAWCVVLWAVLHSVVLDPRAQNTVATTTTADAPAAASRATTSKPRRCVSTRDEPGCAGAESATISKQRRSELRATYHGCTRRCGCCRWGCTNSDGTA